MNCNEQLLKDLTLSIHELENRKKLTNKEEQLLEDLKVRRNKLVKELIR